LGLAIKLKGRGGESSSINHEGGRKEIKQKKTRKGKGREIWGIKTKRRGKNPFVTDEKGEKLLQG